MVAERVLGAREANHSELRWYLNGRLPDPVMAGDFLQDVFFRARRAGQMFCELDNPRAWLFRVARNALADTDRGILEACDLGGMSQVAYAEAHGLSLPAAKARLRRARERLRATLASRCNVETDSSGRICCHKMQG